MNIYDISGANVSTTIFYIDHHSLGTMHMDALSLTRLALHVLENCDAETTIAFMEITMCSPLTRRLAKKVNCANHSNDQRLILHISVGFKACTIHH